MIHFFRKIVIVALVMGCAFSVVATAEDLAVVMHPTTGLTPAAIELERKQKPPREVNLKVLTKGKPQLLVGKSVKEVSGGRAFLIELENPKTLSVPKLQIGSVRKPQGGFQTTGLPYKELVVVGPFSLWHRAAAGADPELLGQAFVWDRAAPIRSTNSGHTIEYTLTDETPAELTEKVLRKGIFDIPELLSHAVADKLVSEKPKPNLTMEGVFVWARNLPPTFKQPFSVGGKLFLDPRMKPPPKTVSLSFRPSRVVKDEDGDWVVEVDMWNRLPVRAAGMLRRPVSKAEGERADALRKMGIGPFTKSQSARFNLAPGEKAVAKFHIPKELSPDPAFFRDKEIIVDLSALGDMVQVTKVKQPSKKGKKK